MQPLQIVTVVCALLGLLLHLIALCSTHWMENAVRHTGLWKACVNVEVVVTCMSHGINVKDSIHATRAFMFFGLFAGAVACIVICDIIFAMKLSPYSKLKVAVIASLIAALCTLIAMSVYTGWAGAEAPFSWSYALGWTAFVLFLLTGGLAYQLSTGKA